MTGCRNFFLFLQYFTADKTITGVAITASKPVCSDANGNPAVCAGTEGVWQAAGSYLTSANIAATITNGDTIHAPDGNSVYDALALKQDYSAVLAALAGISITVDGNNITVPGALITTAADGSRKLAVLANTVAVYPTATSFEQYPDSDNYWKLNENGTEYYMGKGLSPIILTTGGTTQRTVTLPDANVTIPSNPIGGTLGATTNIIPKANGTGTATLQASGITEDGINVDVGALNLVTTGTITGLSATHILTNTKGTHDGDNDAATLSDSGESFTTNQFVGMTLYNITDGSSCTVTANNGTTATCTLTGGTDNNWDTNDAWQVGPGPKQSGSMWLVTAAATIRHPATAGYTAFYMSNGTNKLTVDMASDSMVFKGTVSGSVATLTAGHCIDSSGSTADDFMGIINVSTTSARGLGFRGTWTDGGAD